MDLRQHSRPGRFEVKRQCLSKVVQSTIRRLALARHVNLQGLRYEPSVLWPDNRCELLLLHKGIPKLSESFRLAAQHPAMLMGYTPSEMLSVTAIPAAVLHQEA